MNFENLFQGEFSDYGLEEWLIIGVGALLLLIILFLIFKPKKDKKVTYKEVQAAPKPAEDKPVEVKEPSKPAEPKAEDKPKVKDEPKEPPTPKAAPEKEVAATDKVQRYHVSLNKDAKSEFKGQWRVRKEGSKKTIKYFKTQVEAIKYAEELAENNDTSIVIHKRDGSIRKQDYTKSSK